MGKSFALGRGASPEKKKTKQSKQTNGKRVPFVVYLFDTTDHVTKMLVFEINLIQEPM